MQNAADAARRHSGGEASTAGGGSGSGAAEAAPAHAHRRMQSDESLDEWFDASCDLEEVLLEAELEVAVPPSPLTVAPHVGSGGPPTPCEPADADDWLPPHTASPQTRAAAVAALRTAILATPDAGARPAVVWDQQRRGAGTSSVRSPDACLSAQPPWPHGRTAAPTRWSAFCARATLTCQSQRRCFWSTAPGAAT